MRNGGMVKGEWRVESGNCQVGILIAYIANSKESLFNDSFLKPSH